MPFQLAAFADEAKSSLDGQIQAMARNNISLLEMRGVDGVNCADLTLSRGKEIHRKLADHGISIWALGSPYGKTDIQEDFTPQLEKFKASLALCAETGIRRIRMFSFYLPKGEDPELYLEEVLSRLEEMIILAEDAGVLLCHENEKGIYGDVPARCLTLHKTFGKRLGGVFDPANFLLEGEAIKPAFERLSPYVDYLHVKDARMAAGDIVPAGKGDGQWPFLLDALAGREETVTLTIEPHLRVFEGLAALGQGGTSGVGEYAYPSGDDAFDAACEAISALL